ncbi:histone H3.3, partial [Tricladium varicosporioides]
ALQDIKCYQKTTELLIPKVLFQRLVIEIIYKATIEVSFRIQRTALEALQEYAESILVTEFELTNLAAIYAKHITIQQKDIHLVQAIRLNITSYKFPGQLY